MAHPSSLLRLGAAAGLVVFASGCATTTSEQSDPATPDPTTSSPTQADGTFTASGSYSSPGGPQTVEVEVTLQGGTISAVTVTPGASDPQALRYQQDFADHVSELVVGKPLAEAKVSMVASSSLTSIGFNSALEEIRAQAGG